MGHIKFYLLYNLVNIKIKKQHIASNNANNINGMLDPVRTKYTKYDIPLVHQVIQLSKLKSSAFLVLSIFIICGMYDIHSQIVHITNDIAMITSVIHYTYNAIFLNGWGRWNRTTSNRFRADYTTVIRYPNIGSASGNRTHDY